ncbi:hypothetical protein LS684_23760 (plasmid) [Cytobacillus spongiae]|uniref:hypothetical protein n=1 Tax=Cytobacillus spongiae TaxID=2901381 RepID=UPI00145D4695|nr:hypothetical protein [Cytobacillus spongiae]NMH70339.1 hypothetical protein [Bacillus sp. RO3]UII58606.1 hypothetical protein LS684_23760 [Cytobacillus spongiae]
MKEDIHFRFQVHKVEESGDEYQSRDVTVLARILNEKKDLLYEGLFRVRFNQIGIYPSPADVARQITTKHVQRLLIVELKRYIKPQRRYLTPGEYKPVW